MFQCIITRSTQIFQWLVSKCIVSCHSWNILLHCKCLSSQLFQCFVRWLSQIECLSCFSFQCIVSWPVWYFNTYVHCKWLNSQMFQCIVSSLSQIFQYILSAYTVERFNALLADRVGYLNTLWGPYSQMFQCIVSWPCRIFKCTVGAYTLMCFNALFNDQVGYCKTLWVPIQSNVSMHC